MLDVHPPQHPTYTWKDFFIHIATICVGLLIAIGLEQTVELMHQAHERRLLIQGMQMEARKNAGYLRIDLRNNLTYARWFHAAAQIISAARPVDGAISVRLPAPPDQTPYAIASRSVWSVARASGKVALLPEEQAEAYDRVDYDAGLAMHAEQNFNDATAKFAALLAQLHISERGPLVVTIPAAQQDNLVSELELMSTLSTQVAETAYPWLAGSEAVADGVRTQEDIWPYLKKDAFLLHP